MKRRQKQSTVQGVHVGCGAHVLPGWLHVDNSPTLFLGYLPARRTVHPSQHALWEVTLGPRG